MRTPIAQYKNEKLQGVYSAIALVGDKGIDTSNARKVVIGQRQTAAGYTFRALNAKEIKQIVSLAGEDHFGFISAKKLASAGLSI